MDLIVQADIRVANTLAVFRNIELTHFFTWVTLFGKWQVIFGFVIALSLIFILWKRKIFILPLWVTMGGAMLFNFLSKIVFQRQRPPAAFYMESSFSFPSGHATIAFAFFGFFAYILFRLLRKRRWKINAIIASVIIILFVGFSRLYLGVHYLSDVWAGYLIGAFWLIIGITFSEWLFARVPADYVRFAPRSLGRLLATLGIILAVIVFFAIFAANYHPPLT